jgi:hypothetical protein
MLQFGNTNNKYDFDSTIIRPIGNQTSNIVGGLCAKQAMAYKIPIRIKMLMNFGYALINWVLMNCFHRKKS